MYTHTQGSEHDRRARLTRRDRENAFLPGPASDMLISTRSAKRFLFSFSLTLSFAADNDSCCVSGILRPVSLYNYKSASPVYANASSRRSLSARARLAINPLNREYETAKRSHASDKFLRRASTRNYMIIRAPGVCVYYTCAARSN